MAHKDAWERLHPEQTVDLDVYSDQFSDENWADNDPLKESPNMTRALIYTRVSVLGQSTEDKVSLDEQAKHCHAYAKSTRIRGHRHNSRGRERLDGAG